MGIYTIDTETTTDLDDCRVWVCGICDINDPDLFYHGQDLDFFMKFAGQDPNSTFYFHNLKFDGEFLFNYLFRKGYRHVEGRTKLRARTFTTLISKEGQFYSCKICTNGKDTITVFDSHKIIPFSIKVMAKTFDLDIRKGEIDYRKSRPLGYVSDEEEIEYLKNDVQIPAKALRLLFGQGLQKMTQGSNALSDYKDTVGKKHFDKWFPILEYKIDKEIRQAYRGGFTYLNPKYKLRDMGEGIVFDVNSLYPSVMYNKLLPYGEPISFKGRYKKDEKYPLYIQMIRCQFTLKSDHVPTIQDKSKGSRFSPTQYITDTGDETLTLCLSNVDLVLMFDHYDVYNEEYLGGWKFRGHIGFFKDYIDKWLAVKIQADVTGNKGMRTLAKLMLNALYGKFATNPDVQSKYPYLNEDGIVRYKLGELENRDPVYVPMGVFITAYAREITIRSAQKVYDRFMYADTDSLHLEGTEIPEGMHVHKTELGAWKHESTFKKARYIGPKCYVEDIYIDEKEIRDFISDEDNRLRWHHISLDNAKPSLLNITVAGMPDRCYPQVTWDNFTVGMTYHNKLDLKHVAGGIVLVDTDYTIKER